MLALRYQQRYSAHHFKASGILHEEVPWGDSASHLIKQNENRAIAVGLVGSAQ
jgi:hypothetical protein